MFPCRFKDTGSTAGTIMISFGSANSGVWAGARYENRKLVLGNSSEFEGTRKMAHGFSLICKPLRSKILIQYQEINL